MGNQMAAEVYGTTEKVAEDMEKNAEDTENDEDANYSDTNDGIPDSVEIENDAGDDIEEEIRKEPELDVQLNEKQDTFEGMLLNCNEYNISKAEIAVWSEVDGQDDLIWYPAEKQEDGSWRISGSIDEHKKSTGLYFFHVYAVIDGVRKFVTSNRVEIDGITIENPVTVDKDEDEGTFRINIGTVSSPAGIKNLNVAVWSQKNGQDDLRWYTGLQEGEGQWYVDVDCKDHRYDNGTYIVHVYARDFRGIYTYLSGVRTEFSYSFTDATIKAVVNDDHSGAELILENVTGIWKGTFEAAVWSQEGGQDDLQRYILTKEDKTWKTSFNIKNHKNSTGLYYVHLYYKDAEGRRFVVGTSVNIKGISAEGLQVISCDLMTGLMEIHVSEIDTPSSVRSVKVAVWSQKNGQDDLVWYNMKEDDAEGWKVTVPLSKHRYELGIYNIHAYVVDGRGVNKCVKTMKQTVKVDASVKAEVNEKQNQVTVSMNSEEIPAKIKSIRLAVWSDVNGQDDLKWYVFDKTYKRKIDIKDHKYSIGKYYIHVYASSFYGEETFVRGETFQIDGISGGSVKIVESDQEKGTFHVSAEEIKSPSKVKSVRFAVWTKENGQDDLNFYSGKQEDNLWIADVDTYAHNYESGSYYIHVYAKDERGVENFIGGVILDFQQDMSGISLDISNDQKNNRFVAVLNDNKVGKDIVEIQFAVWSRVKGQDDLKWYRVQKESGNRWTKTVETRNHRGDSGVYFVHAYGILANGSRRCLKTAQTTILNNWEPQVDTKNVTLENLSRDYNFLFVSDTHVIVPSQEDDPDVQNLGNSRIHYFTNSSGLNSEEQFPYWIQYANNHQVDGLLLGGDIIDYPSESNLKYLKDNLNNLVPSYVYAFGNHDWVYPWDMQTQEYRSQFDELMKGSGAAHFVEYDDLIVLTVDDSTYQVTLEALPVVEQALSLGKPVILMMHIPLQTDSLLEKCMSGWREPIVIGPDGHKPDEVTQEFLNKILADESPVRVILAGHAHTEDTSQINERITQYVVDMSAKGKGILLHLNK